MKWVPKVSKEDVNTSISPKIDNASRITNVLKITKTLGSNLSNGNHPLILLQIVQLILFIVDSGCTKHMTGNLKLLCNFIEKYIEEGIEHQTSNPRTPKQNSVVKRQNHTLVEAARTMLSASKLPLFFWAEAIATTCYTQDRSIIILTHEKTSYHIINESIHIKVDEIKEMTKTSVDNNTSSLVLQRQKASYYDNSGPAPQLQNVSPSADKIAPSQQELDLLFGTLYDEFFTTGTLSVNKSSSPTDNSTQQDTPPTSNIQPTTEPITPTTNVNAKENNNDQATDANIDKNEFYNIFSTPVRE
ncbi:retrovirus-related pol polyprotein from transposon TNT 1-94 [Tanacetum coccineum]